MIDHLITFGVFCGLLCVAAFFQWLMIQAEKYFSLAVVLAGLAGILMYAMIYALVVSI